jgi:adenylyltransferase/sulfurtransferase
MKPGLEERYSRQILFGGIKLEGQERLNAAKVTVIGCGATGSSLVSLLARAGIGHIRIVDRDYVEPSNLQRQSLFDEKDALDSVPKAVAAARKVSAFNSAVQIESQVSDLTPENVQDLLGGSDLILDGTDNFETRYLVNDYAIKYGMPWIYNGAVGSSATTMNVIPGQTACLACVFPESPVGVIETCDTAGILNSAVNFVASVAATEALKILVGATDSIRKTLLSYDLWRNERSEIFAATPQPGCRACGARDFIHLSSAHRAHTTLCGRNAVQIHEHRRAVDLGELSERLKALGTVRYTEYVLKFWKDAYEMTLFPDGRAIIKGTSDTALARSLYARFMGA